MQRELSLVSSAVSATRMFIAPFPAKSRSSDASTHAEAFSSFGPWFISPTQRSASAGSDAAGSACYDWDDVLSANAVQRSEITPVASGHSSDTDATTCALMAAYVDEFSADRPFAFGHQVHTLPDASVQELLLLLNDFSFTVQNASCQAGNGGGTDNYVNRDICDAILHLYKCIFGFGCCQRNCMYWMYAGMQLSIEKTCKFKPNEPPPHPSNIEPLGIFKPWSASLVLDSLWNNHYDASGWLPTAAMECTDSIIVPAINQILALIARTCKDVDVSSRLQFGSVTNLIMRSGPVALTHVSIALLDQLADNSKAPDDILSAVQLSRCLIPAYCLDSTLLGALCSAMLACRDRAGMKADVEGALDKLWTEFDTAGDFMRWVHSSIAPKTSFGMLTSRTQRLLNSDATTNASHIQHVTLDIMAKEWRSMHFNYQMRCLRIITRFSARDCPLSSAQWSYLWSLLPETVGFVADDASPAKSTAAYACLSQLIKANLILLCSDFAGCSSVMSPQRQFELPFLDATGQPNAFLAANSNDRRVAVAASFTQLLCDEAYTCRFALAASAAFDRDDHNSALVRTSERSRVALFKLCTCVFGPAFVTRVVVPFVQDAGSKPLSSSKRFKFDPDQATNYTFCSYDMIFGCVQAAITLPCESHISVLGACLPILENFILSSEVMQPNARHFLCSCIRELSSFSVCVPSMSAADGVSALKPVWDMLFSTKGLSMDSDAGYLSKRIDFACAGLEQLHQHFPPACLPFLEIVITLSSHPSLAVRSSVSAIVSSIRLCFSMQHGTATLLPWASSLYIHFFKVLSDRLSDPLSRSLDVSYMKACLCNCTLACPAMVGFFPQLCRLLLLTFEDAKSSDPVLASLDLKPGRMLCSLAEVRFDMRPDVLSGVMSVLRECSAHRARQVSEFMSYTLSRHTI
jgi:hypothetical protein